MFRFQILWAVFSESGFCLHHVMPVEIPLWNSVVYSGFRNSSCLSTKFCGIEINTHFVCKWTAIKMKTTFDCLTDGMRYGTFNRNWDEKDWIVGFGCLSKCSENNERDTKRQECPKYADVFSSLRFSWPDAQISKIAELRPKSSTLNYFSRSHRIFQHLKNRLV